MSNDMTVIIPTYNRLETLRLCLESLENQSIRDFSVILVDDGSTKEVVEALEGIERSSPLDLKVFHQANAGPAAARNLALSHVTTPLSFLIGDDILPERNCLEVHRDFHLAHSAREDVALGWTRWDDVHQKITPFMKWYEEMQFDYGRLNAGLTPTWQHFYTSNLSFKTVFFRENPFDEKFRAAAWEDIELGFRLTTFSGARLTFLENARATHIHPTTFVQAARRMETLGRNERLFYRLWPAAQPPEASGWKAKVCAALGRHPGLLKWLTMVVNRLGGLVGPGKAHAMLLRGYQQRGFLENS